MCGIAGALYLKPGRTPSRALLAAMVEQLGHRGPDGTGFHRDDQIGLGHARLSIIDLVTGDQPIHNEDESVWVVFNGEIFNYLELRAELESRGHRFYTRSDTEVIVHLYEERGEDFVDELNGQFAIALWDKREKKLLLIRDRPGMLPLFYHRQADRLLFASEVKALLPVLGVAPRLNRQALHQLMTFWSPVSPQTMFEDIFEVSPGEIVRVHDGKVTKRRYWDFDYPLQNDYADEPEGRLAEQLHELLIDATRIRLRSDVPVGAYLSGGLDSSIITALIHHHGAVPLRTFSIGFEDRSLDESAFQERLIAHLQANHSSIRCSYPDIGEAFLSTIRHTESPVLRTAPVPMRLLSSLVREQSYKVVLTGEGSDEVFGGYDIFKEAKVRHFWARHPESRLRPLLLMRLYPYLQVSPARAQSYLKIFFGQALDQPELPHFSHVPRWVTTAGCKELFSDEMKAAAGTDPIETLLATLPPDFTRWHPFNRAQYLECKSLLPGYLLSSQGDRMLMASSVEGRFPFLDHRVIQFAGRLHPDLKMRVLDEKYLLKKAAGHYLPREIVRRPKQPYRAPDIAAFFGDRTPDFVYELLSPEKISAFGYFDPGRISLLLKKIRHGRTIGNKDNMSLVGALSTQCWHHLFVERYADTFRNRSVV